MSLPILNTNNILVSAPASVTPPAVGSGEVTYFWNTEDSNRLYYKDDADAVHLAEGVGGVCMPECVCDMFKNFMDALSSALQEEIITFVEYQAALNEGLTVTVDGKVYKLSDSTP